jgi:putative molybdopterin biosynthesis protein
MARPHGVIPAEPPPIVGGSHDPLLQWALVESRAGLAILPEGSERGYRRFLKGEVIAAAIHFHDLHDLDKDANLDLIAKEASLFDAVLIHFCVRDQGLLVARGNPHGLAKIKDLTERNMRVAVRPDGAGAQQLLLALLKREGLAAVNLGQTHLAPTGPDVAQAIRAGHADAGIATRAVALAANLDFVLLIRERFDILMRQRDSYRPQLQTFLDIIFTPAFAARAAELGGLDVSMSGHVRWAP